MGRNKSKQQRMQEVLDRRITIVYCRKTTIFDIVSVLRSYNNSKLWAKTKYEWTLSEWEEFFSLKETKTLIESNQT